jgi:ABC-2 type transport system ATP-binding protein
LTADSGNLEVNGFYKNSEIKNSISYISTNGWMGLEWQLTAKENLIIYGNIYGIKSKELEKRCDDILHLVGMYEDRNKYISQLSAGMRQKITIARGLLIDKPIIYFDEPTVSLDVNSTIQFRNIIKQYTCEKNKTTIITSHVPEDLLICDRILFLYKGRVIAIGSMQDLYKPYKNKKVLTMKCIHYNENYSEQIRKIEGVQQVIVSRNASGRNYNILKISMDDNIYLVNHIVDLLIDKNVIVLNMNINEISLNEIYKQYIDVIDKEVD